MDLFGVNLGFSGVFDAYTHPHACTRVRMHVHVYVSAYTWQMYRQVYFRHFSGRLHSLGMEMTKNAFFVFSVFICFCIN